MDARLRLGRAGVPSRQASVAMLRDLLAGGVLTPVIDRTYPLGEVREAFRRMIGGEALGRVLVTPA